MRCLLVLIPALLVACGGNASGDDKAKGGEGGEGAAGEAGGSSGLSDAGSAGETGQEEGPPGVVSHDGPLSQGDHWSRAWGGDGWCESQAVAFAPDGSIYVTGWFTKTTDFDPSDGVDEATSTENTAVFLSRFTPEGELDHVVTWIPKNQVPWDRWGSEGWALEVDDEANVYLGGQYSGTIDLDPGPQKMESTIENGFDAFLVKLTPEAELLWGTTWLSPLARVRSVTSDARSLLVSGQYLGDGHLEPEVPDVSWSSEGDTDCALVKLSPDGEKRWVVTLGSETSEFDCESTMVNGRTYLSGTSYKNIDLDPGTNEDVRFLYDDVWLLGLDESGNRNWVTVWGAEYGYDSGEALAPLPNGVAVGGEFLQPVDFGTLEALGPRDPGSRYSAYVMYLQEDGVPRWVRDWGNTGAARTTTVAATDEFILAGGKYEGEVDFEAFTSTVEQDAAFLRAFDLEGNPLWAHVVEGGSSFASSVAVKDGVVAVVGGFYGTADFDFGNGSDPWTSEGLYGCWLARFVIE